MEKNLHIALCTGRHEIPQATDGAIFGNTIEDVTRTSLLELHAQGVIWSKISERDWIHVVDVDEYGYDTYDADEDVIINIYVTGLTVALIAALNVCKYIGVKVVLWHYNNATGKYYSQEVK